MMRRSEKRRGFTLIELLLTVVIISSGLFGIMVLYHNATRDVMEGDINLMATYLARERLEQLVSDKVSLGYDHVINDNYDTSATVSVGNNFFTRSFNIYEVERDNLIVPAPPEEPSGFKRIDMTVSWGLAAGQSITIPTLITDY